jgi:hypothetical protein
MKIIITESQYKSLREQTSTPDVNAIKNFVNKQSTVAAKPAQQAAKPAQPSTPTNLNLKGKTLSAQTGPPKQKELTAADRENMHNLNSVFAIGASFFPVIGPLVAGGAGLEDARQYWEEGDKVSAGVVGAFSLLPFVGQIALKIPGVKQLGQKGMATLAAKIAKGTPITDATELAVINGINSNRSLVQSGLNSQVRTLAQQGASRTTNNATKSQLTRLAKKGAEEVGTEVASNKVIDVIKPIVST